jgi:hypothetical protein
MVFQIIRTPQIVLVHTIAGAVLEMEIDINKTIIKTDFKCIFILFLPLKIIFMFLLTIEINNCDFLFSLNQD